MKFVNYVTYTDQQEILARFRPAHRAYATELMKAGKLLMAGPFTDDSGALLIYQADSIEQAEELVCNDPFAINGVFVSYTLKPWHMLGMNAEAMTAA